MKPITPAEIINKDRTIPDQVIESFNELIVENIRCSVARVYQEEVLEKICDKMPAVDRREVINNKWLDIEDLYRSAGWKVDYDKPGYNENYQAYYTFTALSIFGI